MNMESRNHAMLHKRMGERGPPWAIPYHFDTL